MKERKRDICIHCPNWLSGRFEKRGYCGIAKDIDTEYVPEDCTLKLEYMVLEQEHEQIEQGSLQEV